MRNLTGRHCNRFKIGTEQLKRGGFGYHSCKAALNALLSSNIFVWHFFGKVSHNYLTCYRPVPLQFAWKDLSTVIFEFDEGHGYDRSMPYMFGIYCICLFLRSVFS